MAKQYMTNGINTSATRVGIVAERYGKRRR